MLIHKLTADECRDVLSRARLCRLACARSDQPYVVPVSIYYEPAENAVYSFSVLGQKIRWMRDNPLVCLEVEEIVSRSAWVSVVATGRYKEISRSTEDAELRRRASALFEKQSQWWLPATAEVTSTDRPPVPIFFRVMLGRLTGRRASKPE
jgi:nitroimidazol reductase NimA-like FMN-containing flavoprotein (pyridoxamine 5'-phosphate oxidase superfamily)